MTDAKSIARLINASRDCVRVLRDRGRERDLPLFADRIRVAFDLITTEVARLPRGHETDELLALCARGREELEAQIAGIPQWNVAT